MTNEGTRRIYLLAKFIILFGALAGAAFWYLNFRMSGGGTLLSLYILITLPLICGGTLWAITWTVEGFVIGHR